MSQVVQYIAMPTLADMGAPGTHQGAINIEDNSKELVKMHFPRGDHFAIRCPDMGVTFDAYMEHVRKDDDGNYTKGQYRLHLDKLAAFFKTAVYGCKLVLSKVMFGDEDKYYISLIPSSALIKMEYVSSQGAYSLYNDQLYVQDSPNGIFSYSADVYYKGELCQLVVSHKKTVEQKDKSGKGNTKSVHFYTCTLNGNEFSEDCLLDMGAGLLQSVYKSECIIANF